MLQMPEPLTSLKVMETYTDPQLQITTDHWDATLGGHTLLWNIQGPRTPTSHPEGCRVFGLFV